ncbi:DUF1062 domain-containing protein [Lachnospiraceae bacterium 54-53]
MNRNLRKQWIVTPDQLPAVLRRCPKCGKKTEFINSGKFRVNANGRLIDVWMIYRCVQCDTSWNMTVWERVNAGSMDEKEYEGFLKNDPDLAAKYGNDRDLFAGNKAEAAPAKAEYHVTVVDTPYPCKEEYGLEIGIKVPSGFDLRADALLTKQLSVSRERVKRWCEEGLILNGGGLLSSKDRIKDGMVLKIKKKAFPSESQKEGESMESPCRIKSRAVRH